MSSERFKQPVPAPSLGHEPLDTLKHYAKLTINDLRKEHQRCHPRERDGEEQAMLDGGNGKE